MYVGRLVGGGWEDGFENIHGDEVNTYSKEVVVIVNRDY